MAQEPSYIVQLNIRHYEQLLKDPNIAAVTRETVVKLLGEARADLSLADVSEAT